MSDTYSEPTAPPPELVFDEPIVALGRFEVLEWSLQPRLALEVFRLLEYCNCPSRWRIWFAMFVLQGHSDNGVTQVPNVEDLLTMPRLAAQALIATASHYGIAQSPKVPEVHWHEGTAAVGLSYEIDGCSEFVLTPCPTELHLAQDALHPSRKLFHMMACSPDGWMVHGLRLADALFLLAEVLPQMRLPGGSGRPRWLH